MIRMRIIRIDRHPHRPLRSTVPSMRIAARAIVAILVVSITAPAVTAPPPIFRFESDEFWLNLHSFLYVLGRAEDKFADARREAVATRQPRRSADCSRLPMSSARHGQTR